MKSFIIRPAPLKSILILVVVMGFLFAQTSAFAQAPTNDDFANATILSGTNIVITGTTLNATAELNEPSHADYPAAHSVWYVWTAPANGSVLINLAGSAAGSDVSVYVGKYLTTLSSIAANAGGNSDQTGRCVFQVAAGNLYEIAVDVTSGNGGPMQMQLDFTTAVFPPVITAQPSDQSVVRGGNAVFSVVASGSPPLSYQWLFQGVALAGANDSTLNLSDVGLSQGGPYQVIVSNSGGSTNSQTAVLTVIPPPPNDDFSNRIQLTGENATTTGSNAYATLEPGEPDNGWSGAQSVWWTWTAPTNGVAVLAVSNFSGDQVLSVYTGGSLTNLELVSSAAWFSAQVAVQFPVIAATPYQIAVDGVEGTGGEFRLALDFTPTNFPPVIVQQPTNETVLEGGSATFRVGVTSVLPCTFQWFFSNTIIVGATNLSLVLNNVKTNEAGP